MSDPTHGMAFDEDGEDFVLTVTGKDGVSSSVRFTADQLLTLSQSATTWRERILLRRLPKGAAGVRLVTPVHRIGIEPNMLGTAVLLTLQSATETTTAFALSPHIVRQMVEHLPAALAEVEAAAMTRQ